MNIFLTGFMGTGKSATGKILAEKLRWQFFDIDLIIEEETGMKISEIFSKKGETYFRRLETETIKLISLHQKAVVACGGGAVLKEENMAAMEKTGIVVCLKASAEMIYQRIKDEKHRPLLDVQDPPAKIKEMLAIRDKYYKRCSISVDTTDLSPAEVAGIILDNPKISKASE